MVDVAHAVSEKVFQLRVLDYAAEQGWEFMHISDSRRSYSRGFPDCVFARGGRLMFVELKTMTGRVTGAQARWATVLKAGPAEYYLWRPDCWGDIERILGPLNEKLAI